MQTNFKTNQEVSQCGITVVQYTKQILQNKKKSHIQSDNTPTIY